MIELAGDKEEVKIDPETGQEYIIIDVRCVGCHQSVSPAEVDWELFRIGIPVHSNNDDCYQKAAENLHAFGKLKEA